MKRKFRIYYNIWLDVEADSIDEAKELWKKNSIPNDRVCKVTEIEPYGDTDVTNEFVG